MKKIAVSVIKLIIINITLNLIINAVKYALDVEINEIVAYIIYFIENLIIIFIGVKILWQKFNVETVKKIVYIVTVIFILYNIFSVAMAITQYEKYLTNVNSQNSMMNYSSSTVTGEGQEVIENSNEIIEQEREAEKDAYYALLIRSNGIIYNIMVIVLYCFVAPKWFKSQKQAVQDDSKYDFYKD